MAVESRDSRLAAIKLVGSARQNVSRAMLYYSGLTEREKDQAINALCTLNELMVSLVPIPSDRVVNATRLRSVR